jgi:hypothetical protein
MDKIEADNARYRERPWQTLTLAQYVLLRNGVPLGHGQSLRNMLQRSLGAASFAAFWQYWNPIWGYGLGKYVYAPLRRVLPAVAAFLLTFIISGGIHDLVTMAISRYVAFFFTPWFFLLAVGAVIGRVIGMDLADRPWGVRAGINLTYLLFCLALTLAAKQLGYLP